jgi:hypothetical protein
MRIERIKYLKLQMLPKKEKEGSAMKEEHTLALLKECSSGCKMALNSINQILEYVQDEMLEHTILEAKEEHEKLEKKCGELLRKQGEHEKQPGFAAEAFSKITTDVKMMMNGGNCQIAKLLMDGCNMGIQSISECRNQNQDASKEAMDLAAKIIRSEEEFMKKLRVFL